jgi:hypothetical protein
MNARWLPGLVFLVVSVVVVAGCASPQGQAFMDNIGGVEGLMKNIKQATGTISEPEEIQMGEGMTETLLGARPMQNDPELQRYVNFVGAWVAAQSERPNLPWHFAVNDSEHVNAFAAPGGYIIVTRGMMNVVQNEAELAGVLGHEIGHVIRKHHLNAVRKGAYMNLLGAGAAGAAAGSRGGELVTALVGPTKELYARGLDKGDEYDADRIGVVLAPARAMTRGACRVRCSRSPRSRLTIPTWPCCSRRTPIRRTGSRNWESPWAPPSTGSTTSRRTRIGSCARWPSSGQQPTDRPAQLQTKTPAASGRFREERLPHSRRWLRGSSSSCTYSIFVGPMPFSSRMTAVRAQP